VSKTPHACQRGRVSCGRVFPLDLRWLRFGPDGRCSTTAVPRWGLFAAVRRGSRMRPLDPQSHPRGSPSFAVVLSAQVRGGHARRRPVRSAAGPDHPGTVHGSEFPSAGRRCRGMPTCRRVGQRIGHGRVPRPSRGAVDGLIALTAQASASASASASAGPWSSGTVRGHRRVGWTDDLERIPSASRRSPGQE
jgi:hypothetical protein